MEGLDAATPCAENDALIRRITALEAEVARLRELHARIEAVATELLALARA